jgi:hypothetical protein
MKWLSDRKGPTYKGWLSDRKGPTYKGWLSDRKGPTYKGWLSDHKAKPCGMKVTCKGHSNTMSWIDSQKRARV